jgi:hypothetical protein
MNLSSYILTACARSGHEANRAFSMVVGDNVHPPWEQVSEDQARSVCLGVVGILAHNHNPEQSHEVWRADKIADGWRYAAIKDVAKKEHNCLVNWADLPFEQQAKNELFVASVKSMAAQLWKIPQ